MHDVLQILPFIFLRPAARQRMLDALVWQSWPAGKVILRQGDLSDDRVFLLAAGTVDVIDHTLGPDTRLSQITAGNYFGERPALFGVPRAVEVRAGTDCETAYLPGDAFLALLRDEPALAHAMTFIVRDKHGMFDQFQRFVHEVGRAAGRGHLSIDELLPLYRELEPALHRQVHSDELDLGALTYVVRRLPDDVGRTFLWFATDAIPPRYQAARPLFRETTSPARRRATWAMMPGKTLTLLRDGISDLLDLVTCLCIYSVEARKLRHRLTRAELLVDLAGPDALDRLAHAFRPHELTALTALWGDALPERLLEIALHHEDITIQTHRTTNNYDTAHAEAWTQQIARATHALLDREPWALPDDFEVHIVSSNTHSVSNCLCPWLWEHAEAIRAWGRIHAPEIAGQPWEDPSDLAVALVRAWLAAHPEAEAARCASDAAISARLDESAFTGIAVQLFDLGALRGKALDPSLPTVSRPGLLVNIDYAFGQQAEPLIANLINLFGRRIRSINVLGKAGGLRGRRGDVMVATAFVTQLDDVLQVPPIAVDIERLRGRIGSRGLHVGRVLTVLGTVLQNDRLLHFYEKLWDCVGLEMEGTYYCRQALESRELGLLRDDIALRFLYYTSDLPLEHAATLSAGMTLHEGIPPLYATTREVLTAILEA